MSGTGRDLVVHVTQSMLLLGRDRRTYRNEKVTVTVKIGIVQRERALQIGANYAVTEDLCCSLDVGSPDQRTSRTASMLRRRAKSGAVRDASTMLLTPPDGWPNNDA
jgi:hypothetical protein